MPPNDRDSVLRVGDWRVDSVSGQISRGAESARLEARTMRLLVFLAERAGEVVSIDELLANVWAGVIVTPDSVYQAVTALRRVLGDDPKQPRYIATVPRRGYRVVAQVGPWIDASVDGAPPTRDAPPRWSSHLRHGLVWGATAMLGFILVIGFVVRAKRASATHASARTATSPQPQRSVAVLPFLDLTEGMKNEIFADGMTEELIDRISRIPGVRVPAPTASFYYKGKQLPVADVARALNVAYVVDGSVRKSGTRLRVAARLVRADNGYVVWSESYDRPFDDLLMVQDDIASQVTRALRASIGS